MKPASPARPISLARASSRLPTCAARRIIAVTYVVCSRGERSKPRFKEPGKENADAQQSACPDHDQWRAAGVPVRAAPEPARMPARYLRPDRHEGRLQRRKLRGV